jgi:hypothetical protein
VTVEPLAAIVRPTRDGSHVQTLPRGKFGRLRRRHGHRQLIYGPGLFFKIGRTDTERRMIAREAAAAQAAARHPFWKELPVRAYRLLDHGFVQRRGRPATTDDFDSLVEIVEARFEAARAYPATDALEGIERRPLFGHLDKDERRALGAAIGKLQLPRTSMHGDVHVFNFVFFGDAPRLVDWEFFDADGSFVYDYLDFFISVMSINSDDPWHAIMRGLRTSHPAIVAVAARLDLAPQALLAYYLFLKINTIMSLGGSFTTVGERFFDDHMAGLRRTLMR